MIGEDTGTDPDNAHLALLRAIRTAGPGECIPDAETLAAHLEARLDAAGPVALVEFQRACKAAAERWGAEPTAHFGRVLRRARARAKPPPKTKRAEAIEAIGRLPVDWRPALRARLEPGADVWSADHTLSVARALHRWRGYAGARGLPLMPTGAALDAYGQWLIGGGTGGANIRRKPPSLRSVADYLARIETGLATIHPGADSPARAFVVRDWRERADRHGPTTKTGAQLVGASVIYGLGFDLIQAARHASPRGVDAARLYRNGLILAVGAALPERARALAALAFGTTLRPLGEDRIHVRLPPSVLKMPERLKADAPPFDAVFANPGLAEALETYRRGFRPIFDDGACLFPSVKAPGQAIGERQIGRLSGDLTEKAFGVRIPIHRLRDNVATEASETLAGGGLAATALLRHRDPATTARHYDHADGLEAARAFAAEIDRRRSRPTDLDL